MRTYDARRKAGVHFVQCFHWALANTNHGTWHSCFDLGTAGPYGGPENKSLNLKYGIGIARYGQLTLDEKNELPGRSSTTMFNTLAQDYRDIQVESVDDILDPQYAKYYENPELARK